MNKQRIVQPIVSYRRIDQLRAIASDCGFTREDAKQFGKLSKTATWEALLKTYGIPPQVAGFVDKAQSLDTGDNSFSSLRVLGVSICKNSVVGCLLTHRPSQPREVYDSLEFCKLSTDAAGIKQALDLNPHVAVIRRTRKNYQRSWIIQLARAGVEVKLVGNKLPSYRSTLDLLGKDDKSNALALACYYFDYQHLPQQFLVVREAWFARL
jgi:hypothetical protein